VLIVVVALVVGAYVLLRHSSSSGQTVMVPTDSGTASGVSVPYLLPASTNPATSTTGPTFVPGQTIVATDPKAGLTGGSTAPIGTIDLTSVWLPGQTPPAHAPFGGQGYSPGNGV
jgi:hypothetical protein